MSQSLMRFSKTTSPARTSGWLSAPASAYEQNGVKEVLETLDNRKKEWDRNNEAQTKLFECQWQIVTEQMNQISSLVEGLAALRQEVATLKGEHLDKIDCVASRLEGFVSLDCHTLGQERIDRLEKFMSEATERHDQELANAHNKFRDVHGAMREFQGLLDGHGERMGGHHASFQERLTFLENQVGESADNHGRGLDEAHRKLSEFHGHHATIDQRLGFIEKLLGESADKHDRHAKDLDSTNKRLNDCHQALKKHGTIESRLEKLEKFAADAADKQVKDHNGVQQKLQDAVLKINQFHGTVKGERDSRDKHHATFEQRLNYVEKMLGDSADKHKRHLQDIDAIKKNMGDFGNHVMDEKALREQHHASVAERLQYLERCIGDSADQHEKHAKDLTAARQHHTTMEQRLEFLEDFVGDSADKHAKQLDALGSRFDRFDGHIANEKSYREQHHASIEQRVEYIEQLLGDSADKHQLNSVKDILGEVHSNLKDELSAQHKRHASMEQRIEFLEAKVCDSLGKHTKELEVASAVVKEQLELSGRVSAMAKDLKEESTVFTSSRRLSDASTYGKPTSSIATTSSFTRSSMPSPTKAPTSISSVTKTPLSGSSSLAALRGLPGASSGLSFSGLPSPRTPRTTSPKGAQGATASTRGSWDAVATRLMPQSDSLVTAKSPSAPARCSWDAVAKRIEGGNSSLTPTFDGSSAVKAAADAAASNAEAAAQLRSQLDAVRAQAAKRAEAVAVEVKKDLGIDASWGNP